MNLLITSLVIFLQISSLFGTSVIDCNFEGATTSSSWCGWSSLSGSTSWTVTNSKYLDPGRDHTCSLPFRPRTCGHWLSSVPSSNFSGTQDFTVISPRFYNSIRSPYCLRFWYHFFGLEKAQFDVKINNQKSDFNAYLLWAKTTPQSSGWIQGYVNIQKQTPYSSSFYILFHAQLTSKFHDSVGIDDITVTSGPCPLTPFVDFENGLEAWTSTAKLTTGGTPIVDHTLQSSLGHYLFNSGNNQKSLISANLRNLTSEFTNNRYYYCLKLWYFFIFSQSSQDTDSYILLNVTNYRYRYTKQLTIKAAYEDGLINQWEPMFFSIPNTRRISGGQKAQINITLFGKGSTQIAIDDLLVSDQACETTGACDFEADFCSWRNTGRYLWLRNTGANQNIKKSPPIDTTTLTNNGWYAVVPLEYVKSYQTATLKSLPFSADSGYSCFRFNYWAVGNTVTPALYVIFYDLTKFGREAARVSVNSSINARWNRFEYSLNKLPTRFSIAISTTFNAHTLTNDLAIDDIYLSQYRCRNSGHPVTTVTTPIPYKERKWDCNFDYSCSQWSFDKNWKIASYRQDAIIGSPRSDHTRKTPEGKYLLYMPSQLSQNQSQTVISFIKSTALSDKQQHCLSFWYYDSTEILFTLGVYLRSKQFVALPRTVRPNVASRSWKMVKADLWTYYQDSYIQLNFTTNSILNGSFAIDDIKIVPGVCQHVDDYIYTFDSMDDLEINRISPLNSFMGTIHFPNDRSYPNAPTRDHTSGTGSYFLFQNRLTDYNSTYVVDLVLNDLPFVPYRRGPSPLRCFRFAYQIYGNASLNVFVSPVNSNTNRIPIFTSFAYHTNWVIAQVPYTAYYEHKIVFHMTKPFDTASYVALDDISVSSHNCKQPVECDFDDDMCSYTSRYFKADYDFARYVGPPDSPTWPGPPFDHSKRGYGGGYMAMSGYPTNINRTRYSSVQTPIETYRYSIYSNYCISFWTQLTAPDAELTFTLGLYGGRGLPKGTSTVKMLDLVTLTNQTQSKWTWYSVDITRQMFSNYHEFNLQISGTTKQAKTVIALDDIQLSRTSCDYGYKFKCGDGTIIGADKLCNFKKDCSDNSDEKSCGECDFESGTCGWSSQTPNPSVYTAMGHWTSVSAKSNLGPNTDGNGNPNGHYLLLRKYFSSKLTYISETILTRDYQNNYKAQFKDSYFTCTMTFDYFLNSNRTYSAARLEVNAGIDVDSAVFKGYYATKSNVWQKGLIYVGGFSGSFIVQFMGSQYVVNETIALDNIQFHNCSFPDPIGPKASCPASTEIMCKDSRICIDSSDLCDFEDNCGTNWDENYAMCANNGKSNVVPNCAFERSLEYCGFTMEKSPKKSLFNWKFTKGYDYNLIGYSGPAADHTTKDKNGQFLILKPYNMKYVNTKARLYTPFMHSKGGPCWLRFFYYNNGNISIGSYNQLKVWVQYADGSNEDSGTLFSSNSYMANWNKAKVKYSSSSAFRFVFEGKLAAMRHGSISLDDVSYSSTCIASPNSKRTPGSHSSSAAVTIILVLLAVGIIGGVGFFLFRKHQSGELVPYIDRLSSMIPGTKKQTSDPKSVVNVNYKNDVPSTSTAEN